MWHAGVLVVLGSIVIAIVSACDRHDEPISEMSPSVETESRTNTPESLRIGRRCDRWSSIDESRRPSENQIREAFVAVPAEEDPTVELLFSGTAVRPGDAVWVSVGLAPGRSHGVSFEPLVHIDSPEGTHRQFDLPDVPMGTTPEDGASLCLPLELTETIEPGAYRVWVQRLGNADHGNDFESTLSATIRVLDDG